MKYSKKSTQRNFSAGTWPHERTAHPIEIVPLLAEDEVCTLGCHAFTQCSGEWQFLTKDWVVLCPYEVAGSPHFPVKKISMEEARALYSLPSKYPTQKEWVKSRQ